MKLVLHLTQIILLIHAIRHICDSQRISVFYGAWKERGVRTMTLLWLWWMVHGTMATTHVLGLDAGAKAWIKETCRSSEYCQQYLQGRGRKYDHARHVDDMPWPEKLPEKPVRVGFVTSNPQTTPEAGDIYTCANLGKALHDAYGWTITTFPKGRSWYDVRDVDLLVVALDRYDLRKVNTNNPNMLAVAWVRNWFRRWWKRPWYKMYHLHMASSALGAQWLQQKANVRAFVLRLGVDHKMFQPGAIDHDRRTDYSFVGSNWGGKREIFNLDVANINGSCAFYGVMLKELLNLQPCVKGVIEYNETAKLYSSSKVVIDDTNHVTGPWGSLNSRVYEGIAAGSVVVTNNIEGGLDAFDGKLPSWTTAGNLKTLLHSLIGDERLLAETSLTLRREVLQRHTYAHRATEFICNIGEYLKDTERGR